MEEEKLPTSQRNKTIIKAQQNSCNASIQKEREITLSKYPRLEDVLLNITPNTRYRTFAEAYNSGTPTLSILDLTYGKNSAEMWLVPFVSKAFGVCGFLREQVTNYMIENTAGRIRDLFYYLTLGEIAYFFTLFAGGEFEIFKGSPNPQVIMRSLLLFNRRRMYLIEEALCKRKQGEERDESVITFEEWKRQKEAKGEKVSIDFSVKKGLPTYSEKKDAKYEAAKMIVKNTYNVDFDGLATMRETFIKSFGEDPYKYYKEHEKR